MPQIRPSFPDLRNSYNEIFLSFCPPIWGTSPIFTKKRYRGFLAVMNHRKPMSGLARKVLNCMRFLLEKGMEGHSGPGTHRSGENWPLSEIRKELGEWNAINVISYLWSKGDIREIWCGYIRERNLRGNYRQSGADALTALTRRLPPWRQCRKNMRWVTDEILGIMWESVWLWVKKST